jgi:hypothetical protein
VVFNILPKEDFMTTLKKIHSNRSNARKSTGPKTQAGKQVSRRNSLVHGLTAEVLLLDHEDPAEFQALRDAIYAAYLPPAPRGAVCLEMADKLSMNLWRARRIPAFERALIAWVAHRMHATHDAPGGATPVSKPAKSSVALVPTGLSLAKVAQGDGGLQRLQIGRALEALLESNALGKLDAHQARLFNEMKYLMDWLELQKRARFGFPGNRTATGARIIDPDPEPEPEEVIPPRPVPPSVQGGIVSPIANAVTANVSATSLDWAAGSARGGYVSATEREARKQAVQGTGGSANTAG